MKNRDYFKLIEDLQAKGLAIMGMKNADYAEDGNPFKNFDLVEPMCNISSEKGIHIRMTDKMTRIGNLLDREGEVKDESIEDTILDLANYSLILLAKIKSRKDEKMLYN